MSSSIKATSLDQQSTNVKIIDQQITNNSAIYLSDCCEAIRAIPDNSIDFIIYSPPFASLYTYSNSVRDMGNSKNDEFYTQYKFLSQQLMRVLVPGRLMSIHCMNLAMTIERNGVIGLEDFRGKLVKMHSDDGMIYHSEVTIWKDPVIAMQRTKSIRLLYKQLKKDSCISAQGIPDYLCTFRKPGLNPKPVTKDPDIFPIPKWQNYASPVWMDINPSNTLQKESAREEEDEKHICPLQLEVIERAIELWTNPNDVILDPFAGIGSTGYVAIKNNRKFIGTELKESYYKQACLNLQRAEREAKETQGSLLDLMETGE